jgi:hypothetical protein
MIPADSIYFILIMGMFEEFFNVFGTLRVPAPHTECAEYL